MEHVVIKYLADLNIPIAQKYCKKLIASHPNYPSLLSITDTLQRLGIHHKTARIKKKHLSNVEYPYLLWPDEEGREPIIIKDQRDLSINGEKDQISIKVSQQAVVLKAQPADTIANEEHNQQRWQEFFFKLLSSVLVAAVAGLIFLSTLSSLTGVSALLLLTAFAGAVVGYLLIAKEVGINYELVEAFCRDGQKTNCDILLNSDAAQLFRKKITFSDATASYFLFQLLVVGFLLPLGEPSFLWILVGLSALTVPFIGYSLWYQALKAKTWCRLCLIVNGLLIVQVGLFGYLYYDSLIGTGYPGLNSLAVALLLFGSVGSAMLLLKHKIKVANSSEQAEIVANRIKNYPEVFMFLLRREKRVNITPFEQELFIGNPDAPIKILMAASLGCGPCKEGFEQAMQLVTIYPQNVNLSIRLRTGGGRSNGDITPGIALLGYWQQHIHGKLNTSDRTEQLIRNWYESKNLEEFSSQYPWDVNSGNNGDLEQLETRHTQWMEQEEISATPTFFINGTQLPRAYQIVDLMGIVLGFAELVEKKQIVPNK